MENYVKDIVEKARNTSYSLATLNPSLKNKALLKMAGHILLYKDFILKENEKDIELALKDKTQKSFIDRLILNEARLEGMSSSLREIAELPDPINRIIDAKQADRHCRPGLLLFFTLVVPF